VIIEILLLIFFINLYQINMSVTYLSAPPGVHCDLLSEGMQQITDELAYIEYSRLKENYKGIFDFAGSNMLQEGYLGCFCNEQLNVAKLPADTEWTIYGQGEPLC
jgi:hypothetical protein